MMAGHFKVVCPKCGTVLRQCRCPEPKAEITDHLCADCLALEEQEND